MVDPEIRNEVPHEQVGPAEVVAEVDESGDGNGETDVAQHDQLSILGLVERTAWVKVVDTVEETVLLALSATLELALVVVMASDIGQEVVGPANQLLTKKHDQGYNGGLLAELGQLMGQLAEARSLLLASLGYEDHVTLDVTGGLVVLAVGDLPAEVRHKEGRMEDPTDGVIEHFGGAEGLVTTLVSQHPHAGTEQALDEGVESPEHGAHGRRGDVLGGHVVVEEVEGRAQTRNVTEDIVETCGSGALVAVLGNGITDVLDGVVGDLKLIAVGVNELAEDGLLDGDSILRSEGGQRGGRGRGPRRVEGRGDGRNVAVCRRGGRRGGSTTHSRALAGTARGLCGSHTNYQSLYQTTSLCVFVPISDTKDERFML